MWSLTIGHYKVAPRLTGQTPPTSARRKKTKPGVSLPGSPGVAGPLEGQLPLLRSARGYSPRNSVGVSLQLLLVKVELWGDCYRAQSVADKSSRPCQGVTRGYPSDWRQEVPRNPAQRPRPSCACFFTFHEACLDSETSRYV